MTEPIRIPHLSTREAVITEAAKRGIDLVPSDITMPEPGFPEIDEMPANQWLDAMTEE